MTDPARPIGQVEGDTPACRMFCQDGERGEFGRDGKPCARCGEPAWKHWTQDPRGAR